MTPSWKVVIVQARASRDARVCRRRPYSGLLALPPTALSGFARDGDEGFAWWPGDAVDGEQGRDVFRSGRLRAVLHAADRRGGERDLLAGAALGEPGSFPVSPQLIADFPGPDGGSPLAHAVQLSGHDGSLSPLWHVLHSKVGTGLRRWKAPRVA